MSKAEIILILLGIAGAYISLGIFALRNPGPDPQQCPKDCPVCRGEYDTTNTSKKG
jgi:hypothetical protein